MTRPAAAPLLAVVTTAGLTAPAISADGDPAICDFYNHGDYKKQRSGPCKIAESGEKTEITLNNGEVYTPIPERKREGHFVDRDGNRAAVKHDNDYKRTYSWKNQRLILQKAS
jgi:hypothetical protein